MAKLIDFILFGLLLFLGFYVYILYGGFYSEPQNLSIIFKQELPRAINTSSELVQFVPNMRFAENTLSYSFEQGCNPERILSTNRAFSIISNKTKVLSFYQILEGGQSDILIKCSDHIKESNSSDPTRKTFIAGEGGPTKFMSLEPYSLIIQGEIELYSSKYNKKCNEPLVEIHELLHVFGYNHIDNKYSILYPYLSCDQTIGGEIITDMQRLYKEPAKAELAIENISALKSGRYLNFYIEIKNTGLINATGVYLEVISENKIIKNFSIEDLSPGLMRSLELKNLQLPSSRINSIIFQIKSITPEYYKENNQVEMIVE